MSHHQRNALTAMLDATKAVASGLGTAVDKLMEDGTIKAAAVQGIDELGTALKAFPDAVQAQAVGTVFHPLSSQLAKERGVFDREVNMTSFERVMQAQPEIQAQTPSLERSEPFRGDDHDGLGR